MKRYRLICAEMQVGQLSLFIEAMEITFLFYVGDA